MKIETVKGFRDYTNLDAAKRDKIKQVLSRCFYKYGFEPVETPLIEYEKFVKGDNSNDEAISDIFKLKDKGKRKLALRYEFTFQLKRLIENKKLPYKRFQIGDVFRDEPVNANRFRQFTQCDIDIIGSTIKDEAEVLAVTLRSLKELGVKAKINFNNRKLLNEILNSEKIKNKEEVIREIDKLDKLKESEVKTNLKKYKAEKLISIFKKEEKYFKKYESYKEIDELRKYCKYYGTKINFQPSLARGLSYYNGSIFEIKSDKMRETICAGGSYLVNETQSTGISFGLERLIKLSNVEILNNLVLVISINKEKESIKLVEELRDKNVNCLISYGKISKQLDYANKYKIPFVIFVGEKEVKNKKYKLKDMKSGKEYNLNLQGLIKKLI